MLEGTNHNSIINIVVPLRLHTEAVSFIFARFTTDSPLPDFFFQVNVVGTVNLMAIISQISIQEEHCTLTIWLQYPKQLRRRKDNFNRRLYFLVRFSSLG